MAHHSPVTVAGAAAVSYRVPSGPFREPHAALTLSAWAAGVKLPAGSRSVAEHEPCRRGLRYSTHADNPDARHAPSILTDHITAVGTAMRVGTPKEQDARGRDLNVIDMPKERNANERNGFTERQCPARIIVEG